MTAHWPVNHRLKERLAREVEGEVMFDAASRGRYATDASIYQIAPVGVLVPKRREDVKRRWPSPARRALRCSRAAAAPRSRAKRSAVRW